MPLAPGIENFSLLGGPLHRLGARCALVRGDKNTVPLGLALGWLLWLVLVLLALAQGAKIIFALSVVAVHARLLLALPLLFVAETALDAKSREFVLLLVRSGVAGERALPELEMAAGRLLRWKNSWLPDATSLIAAAALSLLWVRMRMIGANPHESSQSLAAMPLAAAWYWFVCLPLFRFLTFRWAWRLALWWVFLWRLAKSDLAMQPDHPDRAGGLGYLEIVHTRFAILALAISIIVSATFAEDIASGRTSLQAVYPALFMTLLIDVVLFVAPLCLFAFKLRACQERGLWDYTTLSSLYVHAFEQKWIRREGPQEPLLGTPDLQSLADLANSFTVVRNMRLAPISLRLFVIIGGVALVPMAPLLLFDYPLVQLAQMLLRKLAGYNFLLFLDACCFRLSASGGYSSLKSRVWPLSAFNSVYNSLEAAVRCWIVGVSTPPCPIQASWQIVHQLSS
ncbi:MAG: hypothetical protein ACR652_21895 [Methylocystis sp.]|uniref:hypothetical protein n=1 Tax=Methylocystis sp. TaxID=1911079 RepID=UPI003DA41E45